jgi:drug/metabolite transporter (DMT)-like permease
MFLYLVPAAALLIAWLWLGERPQALALLGGVLVVAGVVVVNRRGKALTLRRDPHPRAVNGPKAR